MGGCLSVIQYGFKLFLQLKPNPKHWGILLILCLNGAFFSTGLFIYLKLSTCLSALLNRGQSCYAGRKRNKNKKNKPKQKTPPKKLRVRDNICIPRVKMFISRRGRAPRAIICRHRWSRQLLGTLLAARGCCSRGRGWGWWFQQRLLRGELPARSTSYCWGPCGAFLRQKTRSGSWGRSKDLFQSHAHLPTDHVSLCLKT